ncbi:hypothetical protein SAMN04487770_11944 [Butyrivibrio sp. ob235]|nr:hypothetical protein SAMN04487770_11944 [Butyrivibrio sp. ob235]
MIDANQAYALFKSVVDFPLTCMVKNGLSDDAWSRTWVKA